MKGLVFRCASISEDGYYHSIEVPATGNILCSCNGQSWCSHIEATLVAGERHMVHPDDRAIADLAQITAKGRIGPTPDWKSNWKSHRRWRGLPVRQSQAEKLLRLGSPVVSMEGRPTARRNSAEIAEQHDWFVNARPSVGVMVHLVEDKESQTLASQHARNLGIMLATHEEWPTLAPIGKVLRNHLGHLLKDEGIS